MTTRSLAGLTRPVRAGVVGGVRLGAAVVALPTRLVVSLFWVALVVCVSVVLGVLTPVVVLPAAVVVLALTWRLVPRPVPPTRSAVLGAAAALVLAGAFVVAHAPHVGQLLLVQRDPGFLTLQALWLVEHPQTHMPVGSAADVAAAVPSASLVSDAFWLEGDRLQAQGAKTVPGLLALAGWAAGRDGVLVANLLIGAVALLALYDLARRVTGVLWGLVPVLALALSTPMAAFTRTPFTEPTTMALVLGGLVVLWDAVGDPRAWRFALAGAMVGGGALSRIDGAGAVAGMVLGLGIVATGSRSPATRRVLGRGLLAATAAGLAMVGLGYADLRFNSPGYLADHLDLYAALLALLAVCVLAATVGPLLTRDPARQQWLAHRGAAIGTGAGLVVVALGAALASRPLWLEAHGFDADSTYAAFIAANQRTEGLAVDGTRSYDELTVTWLSWYLGGLTLALALLGAALMARRAVAARRAELLVLLATVGVPGLIYLVRPSITPDQVWAMRRLLPVVMPAVLLCAAWLLHRMWLWGGAGRAGARRSVLAGALAGSLAVLVVGFPRGTWGTLFPVAEYGGRAGEVDALCGAVAGSPVVAIRPTGPPLLPTARIACGVEAVEMSGAGPTSAEELAAIRRAWDGQRVVVASYVGDAVPWAGGIVTPPATVSTPMVRWPHVLGARPDEPVRFTSDLWLGEVQPDGTVRPL